MIPVLLIIAIAILGFFILRIVHYARNDSR